MTATAESTTGLRPEAIAAAQAALPPELRDTPQFEHPGLGALADRRVIVKCESVNPLGCFKGRGTWIAISELCAAGVVGPNRGVIAATAGNFGIGVAYAARAHSLPATIFVSAAANPQKVERIRSLGARVVEAGSDGDQALDAAEAFAAAGNGHFLMDGREPRIAVGAGTLAAELTSGWSAATLPPADAIYVPTGGGALLAGVGAWLRHASPGTRVVGVQPENAPALTLSWRERRYVETAQCDTIADGLAMRRPIPEALQLLEGLVDDFVLVSEDDLLAAQGLLRKQLGITVEPSAAASWAGMLVDSPSATSVIVITGSNVAAREERP